LFFSQYLQLKEKDDSTKAPRSWTPEEDTQLELAVKQCGEKNWKEVSAAMQGKRRPDQCLSRWRKIKKEKKESKKGKWTPDEDKVFFI